ncbi:MAG: hypothetical protein RLW42_13120 [Gammaproteobacteria bacterium]
MSETASPASPQGDAAPTTGMPAGDGAPPAGTSDSGTAAPPAGEKPARARKQSGVAGAVARAAARKSGTAPGDAGGDKGSSVAGGSGEGGGDGAAPAGAPAAGNNGDGGTAAAGAPGADDATGGSTVSAPDDWPDDYKARFAALPNDDARAVTLDFYKDMHRQFSESAEQVARIRKEHEDLVRVVEEHGADPAEAGRLLKLDAEFNKNPRQVLQHLASLANVEVFFERPLPEGAVPEFSSAAEMAEWATQQATAKVQAEAEKKAQAEAEEAQREQYRTQLRTELETARKQYGEPFLKAQTAVMERMIQPLSIEDAYNLVSVPALREQAQEAATLRQQLAAAKAEVETMRKRQTQPPGGGVNGHGTADTGKRTGNPAERAVSRARARKEAASHA